MKTALVTVIAAALALWVVLTLTIPRYELVDTYRLDRRTGEIWRCSEVNKRVVCKP